MSMLSVLDYSLIFKTITEETYKVDEKKNTQLSKCLYELPINNWLDSKLNNYNSKDIINIKNRGSFENYYYKEDIDLTKNKEDIISILEFYKSINERIPREINKYNKAIQIYSTEKVFIDPNTHRYYTNLLFRILVNYCIKNKLYSSNGKYLFNINMKNKFYQFCFKHSLK
jgi:hypothetical protein